MDRSKWSRWNWNDSSSDSRVRTIPRSIPNTQYYWPPAIPIPNTDTDTEYDVIRTTHQCHKFISTGQCYSHSHYRRRSDGWTVCDMRRAWWGLYSRKVVNGGRLVGDTVLSYIRPAFVNSYPGVCGRQREGQTRV